MNNTVTAIVIINPNWFDGMSKLPKCLKSVDWCTNRYVFTSNKTDSLIKICEEYKADLYDQIGNNFGEWRTNAVKNCQSEWIFFIDADEAVNDELKEEIQNTLENSNNVGFAIPRNNYILGKRLTHGGWWPDYVMRLIKRNSFKGYLGELHEQPIVEGQTGHLKTGLDHYKHDDLESMVEKTNNWSQTEADLMYEYKHPPMVWWRFVRPFVTETFDRLIKKLEFLDGTEGLIDGIYQGYSRLISYSKLWEKQQNEKSSNI